MIESILDATKKTLGIDSDYNAFDEDIIIHINSAFSTLNQLGIGPKDGFVIEDNTTKWDTYIDNNKNLSSVKTYLYLRVRLLFDPPSTSYLVEAVKEQIREIEWRLNVNREDTEWKNPTFDITA